jgi:hypothetical protein
MHGFLCMRYGMETVKFIQEKFDEPAYALEWKSIPGLNRIEVQMFGNELRSDKPFAPV